MPRRFREVPAASRGGLRVTVSRAVDTRACAQQRNHAGGLAGALAELQTHPPSGRAHCVQREGMVASRKSCCRARARNSSWRACSLIQICGRRCQQLWRISIAGCALKNMLIGQMLAYLSLQVPLEVRCNVGYPNVAVEISTLAQCMSYLSHLLILHDYFSGLGSAAQVQQVGHFKGDS